MAKLLLAHGARPSVRIGSGRNAAGAGKASSSGTGASATDDPSLAATATRRGHWNALHTAASFNRSLFSAVGAIFD